MPDFVFVFIWNIGFQTSLPFRLLPLVLQHSGLNVREETGLGDGNLGVLLAKIIIYCGFRLCALVPC